MNETIVTVVGNVASDLKARRVGEDGARVVGFRVASSERRWDRTSEAWTDGDRFSAWVTCWRRLGDGVLVSLVKGDPVVVSGRLSVREYEVGTERRYSTEIVALAVGPDLARSTAAVSRRRPAEATGTPEPDAGPGTSTEEDTGATGDADVTGVEAESAPAPGDAQDPAADTGQVVASAA